MPTQSRNKNRRALRDRKNIPEGQQSQKVLPRNRISGTVAGGRANDATERVYRSSAVNWPVKEISPFQINDRSLSLSHVELQEELPKIYACLLSAPGFKDDKVWAGVPCIQELADYLFMKIGQLIPEGYRWNAHPHFYGEYSIVYFKPMPELDKDLMYCPLEWTQELKKSRPELLNLVMAMVGKITREFHISLIHNEYNDMFTGDTESFLDGDDETDEWKLVDASKYNKGGIAYQFAINCQRLCAGYPEEILRREIKYYEPITQRDRDIKNWLVKGSKALENKFSIYHWSYAYEAPECDDGTPIMPHDTLTFEWSFYDEVFTNKESWINDTYSQIGNVEPVNYGSFSEGRHSKPETVKAFKNLTEFFAAGRHIFFKHFESKYKKHYADRSEHLEI